MNNKVLVNVEGELVPVVVGSKIKKVFTEIVELDEADLEPLDEQETVDIRPPTIDLAPSPAEIVQNVRIVTTWLV